MPSICSFQVWRGGCHGGRFSKGDLFNSCQDAATHILVVVLFLHVTVEGGDKEFAAFVAPPLYDSIFVKECEEGCGVGEVGWRHDGVCVIPQRVMGSLGTGGEETHWVAQEKVPDGTGDVVEHVIVQIKLGVGCGVIRSWGELCGISLGGGGCFWGSHNFVQES